MSDDELHPMVDFDATDFVARTYSGAFGQSEIIELERFYWTHLDWYEAHGFLTDGGVSNLIRTIDDERETVSIEDGLRVLVDHHLIPSAIREGVPPFDEIAKADRDRFISSLAGTRSE